MLKYLLILSFAINVSYGTGVKLVDYLVSGSEITEILSKHGIKGNDAKQVQSYVASSLAALGNKKDTLTKQELLNDVIPKNPHKFWRIVADDMSSEDMTDWTKTLEEVAARAKVDKSTAEDVFQIIFL